MSDYFEIDFLDVEAKKSGDAIAMRYVVNGKTTIHITDGGYQLTGEKLADHIKKNYDSPKFIDIVVATHPDGDHTGGLRHILETFSVGELWMHRPWLYADELINRFSKFTNVENLKKRLKEIYPNIAALEEIAINKKIIINEPFQGQKIGAFTVMSPSKPRYLDLIIESEKTPESIIDEKGLASDFSNLLGEVRAKVITFLRSIWGAETFSQEETSAENEMSVIQYSTLNGQKILLTGDSGRAGLLEAANYAPMVGLQLPGIDRFQVPHHGSRRNVSTEVLDRWLGKRLPNKPTEGTESFTCIISSAKEDKDHPRLAVVRAMIHRGGKVLATEGQGICSFKDSPKREGWITAVPMKYPEEQEE